jgi:hypothetical protein
MLTTARHLALPKINLSHTLPSYVFKMHLIITAINGLAFQVASTFSFKYQNLVRFFIRPHVTRAPPPPPSHPWYSSFMSNRRRTTDFTESQFFSFPSPPPKKTVASPMIVAHSMIRRLAALQDCECRECHSLLANLYVWRDVITAWGWGDIQRHDVHIKYSHFSTYAIPDLRQYLTRQAISITYSKCGSVALIIQHVVRIRHITLSVSDRLCHRFTHKLISETNFGGKNYWT